MVGWGNLGYNSGSGANRSTTSNEANTPNIDSLVKSGVRLNRHYTCDDALLPNVPTRGRVPCLALVST